MVAQPATARLPATAAREHESEGAVMQLLETLYGAIDDDGALAVVAETIAHASGCRSGHIHHFTPGGATHFHQMSYFGAGHAELYVRHFVTRDVWLQTSQREGLAGRVLNMDRFVPPEEFAKTELYNDLFRAHGDDTGRCMGVLTRMGPSLLVTAFHRPLTGAAFTPEEETALGETLGHLRRVLQLRRLLADERAHARCLATMVEATEAAMLVVDRKMRILCGSAAAFRVLDADDGLGARRALLHARGSDLARMLHRAVQEVIERASAARTGFLCDRPSGRPAYRLLVLPAGVRGADGALILIDDPATARTADAEWPRQASGLTLAENALAIGLVQGLTLAEVAERRGVTRETVRAQLKQLFAKTGTSRQAELVRLLATMVRHPPR